MSMETLKMIKKVNLYAVKKRGWRLQRLSDELNKWSTYLQESAERFEEDLIGSRTLGVFQTAAEQKKYDDILAHVTLLKKEATQLKVKARKLNHAR